MHLLLLLSLCLVTCNGDYQAGLINYQDWIDPTDMFNYDAASGRMKNRPQNNLDEDPVKDQEQEQAENVLVTQDTECQLTVENLRLEIEKCKHAENLPPSNSEPVFRRYLHKILNGVGHLGLPDDSQPQVHYDAEVVLTIEMLREINKFLDNADWNLGALDEALSRTLVDFKYHNVEEWKWNFQDHFGIDVYTTFMICFSLLCIVLVIATEMWTHIGWFTQIKRLCIIGFVISVGWNWMYLYKVAFAERQAEMAKMEKFDGSCGAKMSWSESLFEWFKTTSTFQNDPCEEYFKSLMIHPALLVPPTKALALTFTDFITEPLKHVGKGIGEFIHNLLSEIPVLYQLPVLLIIAISLLVFCYGTSTSIGQIGWHRNNPCSQGERLALNQPQRPTNVQFIEGANQQPLYEQVQYKPIPSNQMPEVLHALDCVDDKNQQKPQFILADLTITLKENSVGKPQNKYDTRQEQTFERSQAVKESEEEKLCETKDKAELPEILGQQMKHETIEAECFSSQDSKEEPLPNTKLSGKTTVSNGHEEKHVSDTHNDGIKC